VATELYAMTRRDGLRSVIARFLLVLVALAAASVTAQPGPVSKSAFGWTGKWIWTEGDPSPRNAYVYFRKVLELAEVPREVRVQLTADSRYQLWLNGTFVGRGPVRSDRRWLYYDTWDLHPHLKKGKNVLAVLVHHFGESTFQYMQGRGGLLAEVVGSGGQRLARSDWTWKARRSDAWASAQPRMSIQLGFNEIYDARKAPEGWKNAAFDDHAWRQAVELGIPGMEPWPNLVPRDIPPMRETPVAAKRVLEVTDVTPASAVFEHVSQQMASGARREAPPGRVENASAILREAGEWARVKTPPGADVSFLVDFGKEVTGFPRFRVRGARGGEILDLGYGEVLQDEHGGFVPQNGGHAGRLNPDRDGVHYADRYVCRPGPQEFQTFDKRGFRYLQLDVRNAPEGIELQDLSLLFSTFPVENRGAFECSDERLNQIWEIGRYTCQLNMEDAYTDCPWRERAQWWGDARVEALINYYCFGDTSLIRKALRQKSQSLNEEGMTWGVYPTDWDGGRLPSFTLIWVSTLWETYQYTGDVEIVRELFPAIRATLDRFFAPRVGPRGLLKDIPYWVFIDWAPVETKGEAASLNAYYYDALRSAAAMAHLLGDASAAQYRERADSVKASLNAHLWDRDAHAYRDAILPGEKLSEKFSQQANSLCVLFDIAPLHEQPRVLDFIYAAENKPRVVEAGSPYFSYYQLAALFHAGRHDQGLRYIRERWGKMLDWGATTWWETWNPGASFCHGWSGGPTYNLGAEVLGVQPLKPGFAEVSVTPHLVDLKYATGIVPTVKGDVRVAWQWDARGGNLALRVETPDGVPAEVTLPVTGELRVNKKTKLPADVQRLGGPPGATRLRLEGGGQTLVEVRGSSPR